MAATSCSKNPSILDDPSKWGKAVTAAGKGKDDDKPKRPNADLPPERAAVTSASLAPIIKELGIEGNLPDAVSISFAASVIERDDVGNASSGTVLKITPEIAGSLTYTTASELTFTPSAPFEHDTKYAIQLVKLETRDGVIEPAAGENWSHEFTTPPFKFAHWAPTDIDVDKHEVTMEIAFSGPVLPNKAFQAMSFAVNGAKLTTGLAVLSSRTPNLVLVKIVDPRIGVGAKLTMQMAAGFTSYSAKAKAPAVDASYTLTADKGIDIKTVAVVEGANGFYLEVICDDGAAEPGERSYYDEDSYYGLSQRCLLTDEAVAKISFTPAVKKPYITAGRAGFRVFGDFKRGAYSMKIASGAKSVDGGVVLASYSRSFTVSARKPQLSFAASGRYLPRSAWGNLGVKHLNMDGVNLVVREVPPENLVFWLGNPGTDVADDRTSNVILRKTIALKGNPDEPTMSWLDVKSLLPSTSRGVLELKVVGVGGQATSRLLLTDMSLVAKKTATPGKPWEQQVQAWAIAMDDASAIEGVEVSMVRKSGKVVGRCTTGGDGGCKVSAATAGDPDESEPFALIARKGSDLTYIRYQDLRADLADSSTSGVPYVSLAPYRAAMFSDRGVYRPGDTAHVTAIVRDGKDRAPDAELPVDVKVIDPRTKTVRKTTMKTNAAGILVIDHAFPAFADTGHWRVQLEVAEKTIAAYDVQVEEFVPERMKVTLDAKRTDALFTDETKFDVSAVYLFGGNAMDSGVELACKVAPTVFAPTENGDLKYGVEPKGKETNLGMTQDQLDPAGKVTIGCEQLDDTTAFTSTLALSATASVLEAGSGRASVKTAAMTLHPEKYYLGVKTKATKAESGKAFTVEGLVVDWEGKPLPASVKELDISVAHLEYDYGYYYDDYSGESSYDRNMRQVPEGKQKAKVENGKFTFDVTPGNAGAAVQVTLTAGRAKTELVLDGDYSYGYYGYDSGSVDTTPRPAKPTKLALVVNPDPKGKTSDIAVGKAATVKLKSPYKGRVLWTVETDHIVKAEWQDIAAGDATWSFTLDSYAPNVYVSAFVVKDPHLESADAFMPDRAFGVASARVTPTSYTQTVTIDAPREVRSSSALDVKLSLDALAGPTFAVVAVVDEGILQLTNFQTPDPLAQLFAKRALGVETYETIGWTMLHQPAGASSKTGGGDFYGEEDQGALDGGRVQPVKPVALWSGIVPVGPDGKVSIPFKLPTYRGAVRVMAITVGPTKVGRAEAKIVVKDPLVIQTTFPRFVTQNDELEIPVFLTNMSGGPLEINLVADSEVLPFPGLAPPKTPTKPIQFTGKSSTTLKLDNGRSETIVMKAKAMLPVGGAKIVVTAKAGALEVKDELEVPFLPAGPKERVIQKIKVAAGPLDLKAQAALQNWAPTSEKTTFWLTSNPYGESFDHLNYLIHYPYGCIEQTTSSTRPLLYVAAIAEQVDPAMSELKIEDMVLAGINRIFSMETPAGGFGYWPGATEPQAWGTAYATHFLLDAKKAGYAVGDDRLKTVIEWIENKVAQLEKKVIAPQDRWHHEEQAEAYLHYVLALAGKGKKARILKLVEGLKGGTKDEADESRYMLMAAAYLAGDRRFEKELKTLDVSPINPKRENHWSFYSDRRRRAFMLSTFHDLFGADPAGEALANHVASSLSGQKSGYYNTQELVWGVTGLGKWVTSIAAKGAVADGKLTADGAVIDVKRTKKPTKDKSWALTRASEYGKLTLDIPASAAGMWLVISSEGVRPGGAYVDAANGMTVQRTYHTQTSVVDPAAGDLQLGEVVFVELEITNTSGGVIQNIALVDRLPAGLEIENPRLGRGTKADWFEPEDLWASDFMNMRDDRLEVFGTLQPNESKKVIYTARAVTSGRFVLPPVEAEAMYDPTINARDTGASSVFVVGGPWTGKTI